MKFWENVTGGDLSREWKGFEARAKALPADYRAGYERIVEVLLPRGDFSGRSLMPVLDGVLGLLEESAAEGLGIAEVLGDDVEGFAVALVGGERARSYRDKWREQLNQDVAKKLSRLGG
ncbi:DUF1048 domain-containing protein [Catenulispora rubra]|uniref:DUF1048 domain-containing protein n=1 Tax=Catenulispora rubra TaxID=280293 RepID=UPI0018922B36|nr:DUF1048 domain-containing protein [Catenulispora rubra]